MLIKNRRFRPDKCEDTFEKTGFGWAPGMEKKFEGTGIKTNSARYSKNFSRMKGFCLKCDKYTDKKGTSGEHCSLPGNEQCQV